MYVSCDVCGLDQAWAHDHKPDQSGLDDGPPLPSNTFGKYGLAMTHVQPEDLPPDFGHVDGMPDPRDRRIAELEDALCKINALIDSPARFNAEVQAVLDSVIDTSDVKFGR